MKVMLGDPGGIEPGLLGMPNLLRRQTIPLGGRRLIEQPREKAQSLQICETLHEELRDQYYRGI
jgi:hypothetical protein